MRTIFIFALSLVSIAAAPSNSERIIGGIQTSINQYPYMTALLYAFSSSFHVHFCGGTILNTRSILTAAHCIDVDEAPRIRIRVGSSYAHSGGVVYAVESAINHEQHDRPYLDNDISILRTASPIVYDTAIQSAVIAGTSYILPDNAVVWPVGWGNTAYQGSPSEELRHTQVWTINQQLCAQRYNEIGYYGYVTANMLCSGWLDMGGRGQCQGDSGGPVVHNGIVVGITAWGRECALGRFPTVSMRISRYTAWIQTHAS